MTAQVLYRFFDVEGALLYVGISGHAQRRTKDHAHHSPWWDEAVRMEIERHPDRVAVLAAEQAAIVSERPKHNIHHTKATTLWAVPEVTYHENSQEAVTARLVSIKPLYKLQDAAQAIGLTTTVLRQEIAAGRLGYVDVAGTRSVRVHRYISGWQLLDWIESQEQKL